MGRYLDIKFDEAYKLYLEGLSLRQVGEVMSIARQSVYSAFKKRGFALRGKNFKPHQFYDEKKFSLRCNGYYSLTCDDRCLMHRYVWEKEKGSIPIGWDIHHLNNDKSDNNILNLECLPKAEHTRKYSPHNNQYTKGRVKCSI